MADGTSKPISQIKLGDDVLATDPETGEAGGRKVVGLIVGDGYKQLIPTGAQPDRGRPAHLLCTRW